MAERLNPQLPKTSQELYARFEESITKLSGTKTDALDTFKGSFELVTGNGNIPLAEKVGALLDKPVQKAVLGYFADGTPRVKIPDNVRRREVILMQSEAPEPTLRVNERNEIADAAKRASADKIYAVFPYMTFGRQDRKTGSREPISIA